MATGNDFSVGDAIQGFLQDSKLLEQTLAQQIIADWEAIAGKPIADQTVAIWFNKGICYLELRSPAWKQEVSYGRAALIEHINAAAGSTLVKEIKLV